VAHGRVLIDGRDEGGGVALTARLVVTANHVVRGRSGKPLTFMVGGQQLGVARVEAADDLDVAVLHLEAEMPAPVVQGVLVSQATNGARWRVETPPRGNDPVLTGVVDAARLSYENQRGQLVEVMQLRVDQQLGNYGGYSGSTVGLQSPRGAVVGVLVEQQLLRIRADNRPSAGNVLYAVPLQTVLIRFGLTGVEVARPIRFHVPRVPMGVVDRPGPLAELLDALVDGRRAELVVISAGPGGMGKTVLAQQAAHHAEVWRSFPGGVVWAEVGQDADPERVLGKVSAAAHVEVLDDLAGEPTLVIVDDVWSDELVARVRAELPETVTLVATTRGVHLPESRRVQVQAMPRDEAIEVLAQGERWPGAVTQALGELAEALGCWPLLLGMAARYLHLREIDLGSIAKPEGFDGAGQPPQPGVDAVELVERATELRGAFVADPAILDDTDSRQRSLTRMLTYSLDALSPADGRGFAELGCFPPDVEFSPDLLGGLWALAPIPTERRMMRLVRVGLAVLTGRRPLTVRVHDLVMAWLHGRFGPPEDPRQQPLHARCVHAAMAADGQPGTLGAEQADWLGFHLCRTGRIEDPARLLDLRWRDAYRQATGSDASYLDSLRTIIDYYGHLPDAIVASDHEDAEARSEAWLLQGGLQHAYISAQVGSVPVSALVALALLGQPRAALRQAARHPQPRTSGTALAAIVTELEQNHRLTSAVLDIASGLARAIPDEWARSQALAAIAKVLAVHNLDQATELARSIADEKARSQALAAIAEALAAHDLDQATDLARSIPIKELRSGALAAIAEVVATRDPDQAKVLWQEATQAAQTIRVEGVRSQALAAIAEVLAAHDFSQATDLAWSIPDGWVRSQALAAIARVLAAHDVDRAIELALSIPVDWVYRRALAAIAKVLAAHDSDRAIELALRIPFGVLRGQALADIAKVLAVHDARRATEVARSIADEKARSRALAAIAKELAAVDADRATELAWSIPDGWVRSQALAAIAKVLAVHDARRATEVARSIADEKARSQALAAIAEVVATHDPDQAKVLWQQATKLAGTIPPNEARSEALVAIAKTLAAHDPDQAKVLWQQASQTTHTIPIEFSRSWALAAIAGVLARDADQATEVARSIPIERLRLEALADIAKALAGHDPDRATEVARSIPVELTCSQALAAIAKVLAARDADQAIELALSIPVEGLRLEALADIAKVLAAIDADRAAEVARGIADEKARTGAFVVIAKVLAAIDADRAAEVARGIADEKARSGALATIAKVLAAHDADRAAEVARSIPIKELRSGALAAIAEVVATRDPDQAKVLWQEATQAAQTIRVGGVRSQALAAIAEVVATRDPDQAKVLWQEATQAAQTIRVEGVRSQALAAIAKVLAAYDADRAIEVARGIADEKVRSEALADIAKVLAAHDLDRATELVWTIPARKARTRARNRPMPEEQAAREARNQALAAIAKGLAAHDLGRAIELVRTIRDERARNQALAAIAKGLAAHDLDRAIELALTIRDERARGEALAAIANVLAPYDADRAIELARTIPAGGARSEALADIAKVLAVHDLDRATELTLTIPAGWAPSQALADIAKTLASEDPDRALRIARIIRDDTYRGRTLGQLVGSAEGTTELWTTMPCCWSSTVAFLWFVSEFLQARARFADGPALRATAKAVVMTIATFER